MIILVLFGLVLRFGSAQIRVLNYLSRFSSFQNQNQIDSKKNRTNPIGLNQVLFFDSPDSTSLEKKQLKLII